MKQKHDKRGKFARHYTDEDMLKFVNWIVQKRDINECMGQIMMEYKVSPMTSYNWMSKAAKIAGAK